MTGVGEGGGEGGEKGGGGDCGGALGVGGGFGSEGGEDGGGEGSEGEGDTSDRARPSSTAFETSASLCKYPGHRFIAVSGLAEARGGLVAAFLAVAARKLRRCRADSAETFAKEAGLSSARGWEATSTGSHCGGQAPPRTGGRDDFGEAPSDRCCSFT